MSVDSGEGRGTTFRLCFPAISAPAQAAQAGAAPGVAGRGATILVADNERPVLEATSRILRQDGYAILAAASYEEAVSLASSHHFQLLLTDRVMPRVRGPALAERVTELRPGVHVLHMSGYAHQPPDPQRTGAGDQTFIQKPFTASALLGKVHAVLGGPPAARSGGHDRGRPRSQ